MRTEVKKGYAAGVWGITLGFRYSVAQLDDFALRLKLAL